MYFNPLRKCTKNTGSFTDFASHISIDILQERLAQTRNFATFPNESFKLSTFLQHLEKPKKVKKWDDHEVVLAKN